MEPRDRGGDCRDLHHPALQIGHRTGAMFAWSSSNSSECPQCNAKSVSLAKPASECGVCGDIQEHACAPVSTSLKTTLTPANDTPPRSAF